MLYCSETLAETPPFVFPQICFFPKTLEAFWTCKRLLSSMSPDVIFILVLASIFSLTKFAGVKVYSEMKVQMSLDTVQMRVMLSTIKANMSWFLRFPDVSHKEASASFFTVGWGSDTCKVHFHWCIDGQIVSVDAPLLVLA